MENMKQIIGIDVAKDSLVACYGMLNREQHQSISRSATFNNTTKGHQALLRWARKAFKGSSLPTWFVMEATGVYYEAFAYFLHDKKQNVTVLLPNKAKNYVRALNTKTKTDPVDARSLTQYGLERPLDPWNVPSRILKDIKALSRERTAIQKMLTRVRNQLHAKSHSHEPTSGTMRRLRQHILLLRKQSDSIKAEMIALVHEDKSLEERVERISRVKGLGILTVLTVVAETNGFAIIENAKQLTSYAGLDVTHNQSGNHQGKASISKKGNRYLRLSVYMPSLVAARTNDAYKHFYDRLVANRKPKTVALMAVSRKLLVLIYALWKSGAEYDDRAFERHPSGNPLPSA